MRAGDVGAAWIVALLLLAGCRGDGTGPGGRRVSLQPFAGDVHYAPPSAVLQDLLGAVVRDAATGRGAHDVAVQWRVISGAGSVQPVDARSDEFGVARARLTAGASPGTVLIEADAAGRTGEPARFTVHVVDPPVIEAITPIHAAPGEVVAVRGRGFGADAGLPRFVRFGGLRGRIIAAADSVLSVELPACVRSGSVLVDVGIGASISAGVPLNVSSAAAVPAAMDVGEVRVLSGSDLACAQLTAPAGAEYVFITQNAHRSPLPGVGFDLRVHFESEPVVAMLPHRHDFAVRAATPADLRWETRLRRQEAAWGGADPRTGVADVQAQHDAPVPGERRQFSVLTADLTFRNVTAEVRHVSEHAVIYNDIASPLPGLSNADFAVFGQLFDDPIYRASVDVFGSPSDIDGNGRVLILFTPQVNALTKPTDAGFIAGFFYGCDLLERSRCSGTNRAELFYAMVPDPSATFGKRRTRDDVMRTVPGVLAHEFQHMIHFAQRGMSSDLLWLSEALAHAAEDVVARALLNAGRAEEAADMRHANNERAREFIDRTAVTSLISEASPGSLAMRGGVWLLLEYLAGRHGGDALLRQLTQTQLSGVANVEQQTGRPWPDLLADFAVALYADSHRLPFDETYRFTRIDLGDRLGGKRAPAATYALSGTLDSTSPPASSHAYGSLALPLVVSPFDGRAVMASLTGVRGGAVPAEATPQLVVIRTR